MRYYSSRNNINSGVHFIELQVWGILDAEGCDACPELSSSPAGSDAVSDCTCNAGASGTDGGPCLPCAAGKYKSDTGSDACISCPANTNAPAGSDAESDCILNTCNAGLTSDGNGGCAACAAGTYKAGSGNEACTDCGAGKYSAASGATADSTCSACTADSDAPAGSDDASDCFCNAGFFGPDGGPCSSCAAGKYKSMTGSVTCAVDPGFRIYSVPAATNFASRDPSNANRGNCAERYAAGYYHTRVEWYALKINIATLRVDASDHTFANTISGSGLIDMGEAGDCKASNSMLGASMIDLRGTPFAVEDNGMGTIQCSEQPGGSTDVQCSQWRLKGWYAKMEVQCSNQNQLCDIRCGGGSGGCSLAAGYLQLKVLDSQAFDDGTGASGSCPANSNSPAGSDAVSDCTCNAGASGPDGGPCSPCAVGKYKSDTGSDPCISCPANADAPAGSDAVSDCTCNAGFSGSNGDTCSACIAGKYKPPKWALVLQISSALPGSFYYDSPLWSNDETLNAQYTYAVEGIDVKLPAYSTHIVSAVRVCVSTLDNCYEMAVEAASAKDLFAGGYRRRTDLDQVKWQALFEANFPERSNLNNCMQRPGFNTVCRDENRARWGFCANVLDQSCQKADDDDADAAIGLGVNGQNSPTQLGAGYNEYFVSGMPGEDGRSFQAWVYVCSDCTGLNKIYIVNALAHICTHSRA